MILIGILISVLSYYFGLLLKKRFKLTILNPVLVTIVLIIIFLKTFNISYEYYNVSAKYLSYLLTPAIVCLAVPLYKQLDIIKKNKISILVGLISGVITSLTVILLLSIFLGLTHEQYVTLLPKSITTGIGVEVSKELGGIVTMTIAAIVVTGIFGALIAETVCKIFKITNPIAKGFAIGTSSHLVGTTKAIEMGESEGAASTLSLIVCGILTVVLAPIFAMII